MQNHLLDYVMHPDGADFTGFPQAACGEDDPRMCFSPEHWADLVFQQSDTTMAVLSAIPVVGASHRSRSRRWSTASRSRPSLCGDGRVLIQGHAVPNVGPVEAALESMSAVAAEHAICAWKVYTHAGPGWFLDDHDPAAPTVGERSWPTSRQIGVNVVAVHKGLSGGSAFASPVDIGPAAANHPGISLRRLPLGLRERVPTRWSSNADGDGVDRLITSVNRPASGPAATCTPSSARPGGP